MILVPLFLTEWGKYVYGDWLTLAALPVYLGFTDLGVGYIAANKGSMFSDATKTEEAEIVFATTWRIQSIIALIGILLVGITLDRLNLAKILHLAILSRREVTTVEMLLATYVLIGLLTSTFVIPYRFVRRNARIVTWQNFGRLIEVTATGIALLLGARVVTIAAILALSRLATGSAIMVDSRRICPRLRLKSSRYCPKEARVLLVYGATYCLYPIGSALLLQGMTVVTNIALGSVAVVVLMAVRTTTRYLVTGFSMVGNSAWPEFSTYFGSRRYRSADRLRRIVGQIAICVTLVLGTLIVLIGPWFVRVWTRGVVVETHMLFGLFTLDALTYCLWFINSVVLNAGNHHRVVAMYFFAFALLTLPAAYVAMRCWGIAGAPIATAIFNCIQVVVIWHAVKNVLGIHRRGWWKDITDTRLLRRVAKRGLARMAFYVRIVDAIS